MNHRTPLRAMRAPSSALFCSGTIHTPFLSLAARPTRTTPYRRLASSLSTETPAGAGSTSVVNTKLNPPASSRPAPLELPERQPDQSKFSHLFATAKTYIAFYKGGLRAVFQNRNLVKAIVAEKSRTVEGFRPPSVFTPGLIPKGFSRADWLLLWRVRHDILRVPLFGVVLLVCGEFTPLIVIFVDGVVPYTCRLPRQLAASFAQAEQRRHASLADFERAAPQGVLSATRGVQAAARKHVLRSLHLPGMMWDKMGFMPPGMWATKGRLRMAFLEGDDKLLKRDGGAAGLEEQEVPIACTERGIDCAGRSTEELRALLDEWLRLTDAEESVERRKRMTVMLTTKTEKWPKTRDFALPEWHL
ncbi:LETM1-like protein [Colletotrichum musicola]|uniref:LETM1-like protein n=1 Tax=Colletotrichum musicola TaxID=2175873 RepID=A0A8H6NZE3_9PEZI|nr:LETM1-like protein [Colletotrichum musicola]